MNQADTPLIFRVQIRRIGHSVATTGIIMAVAMRPAPAGVTGGWRCVITGQYGVVAAMAAESRGQGRDGL